MTEMKGLVVMLVMGILLMDIGMSVVWSMALVDGVEELVPREIEMEGMKGVEGLGLGLVWWSFAKHVVVLFPGFRD